MISIRQYLDRWHGNPPVTDGAQSSGAVLGENPGEMAHALLQAFRILLEGMPIHDGATTIGQTPPQERIIPRLLARLDKALSPFDVLEIASEALAALENETRQVRDRHRAQNDELQGIISMLAQTVASLSVDTDTSVTRLQQIERQIERASLVEDIRALKGNLSECLAAVREASAQQQKQSSKTIRLLEQQIQTSQAHFAPVPASGPAEITITPDGISASEDSSYAAVLFLARDHLIASRFGESARNQVLAFVAQHLKDTLMPSDRVTRWKGGAFLVLMRRQGLLADVSAELGSLASVATSFYLQTGNRSVLLRISLGWTVFPQSQFPTTELLFKKVDDFLKDVPTSN